MLDFRQKKAPKGVRFSLNPVDQVRGRTLGNKRRIFHFLFLIGIACISGVMLWDIVDKFKNSRIPAANQLKQEVPLAVMAKPALSTLPALPDAAAIAAQRESVVAMLADNANPLWADQPDAGGLAWMEAVLERDRAAPPLPQRVTVRDLVLNHVRVGSAVLMSGLLEDSQPAPVAGQDRGYQRLLLLLEKDQYVEVIAPAVAADLVVGREVQVVGRYLGPATLALAEPVAGSKSVSLPLLAARVVSHPSEKKADDDNPYVIRGAWNPPTDLYDNVDDDRLILETRPYYFTLGQVLLDRTTPGVFDGAPSANKEAAKLHKKPADFRGKPFTLSGHVFHAWEDEGVAKDQPFGVGRVVRAILWTEDWGPYEITDVTGKVISNSNKLVLRAFEIAAISHKPLPKSGDVVTVTGRFLRMRALEVKPNERRDRALGVTRQSDRAFTFFFVTQEWEDVAPPVSYDFTWFGIGLVIFAILLAALLLNMARKEGDREGLVFDSVRKLRRTREQLKKGAATGGVAAPAPSPNAPPSTEAPASMDPPPEKKETTSGQNVQL